MLSRYRAARQVGVRRDVRAETLYPRTKAMMWMPPSWRLCAVAIAGTLVCSSAHGQDNTGRLAGQVVDRDTGRPIAQAQVLVAGLDISVLTDLTGRYRTHPVPAGTYNVEVAIIGYTTTRVDSVRVDAGATALLNVALAPAALALQEISVQVTGQRASSAAGLLAQQKASQVVMDGISAEQISRSPDSDASDAIARVTGVSVVDNRYVIVRGLAERYSNTLLNGAELPSPEPAKRVVPLDIFPASLLQSVVTKKTATPDMPGDFAGGSVELQTKDFPESRVLEFSLSQGYNSQVTFQDVGVARATGWRDWFGLDGAGRSVRPERYDSPEELLESQRRVWTPQPRRIWPDIGAAFTYGDQFGEFDRSLGLTFSVDYGRATARDDADYFAFVEGGSGQQLGIEALTRHSTVTANLGVLANTAVRLGSAHKLALKNMMTHEAEEFFAEQDAFDGEVQSGFDDVLRRYQVRYIERTFMQSQLSGEHFFPSLLESRIRWAASYARADRDEPENRTLVYARDLATGQYQLTPSEGNFFWFRFLDDAIRSASLDWTIAMPWFGSRQFLFRTGTSVRRKARDFDASLLSLQPLFTNLPDGVESLRLPPEQVVAPENVGRNLIALPLPTVALPYDADESVDVAYGMLDVPVFSWLRLVGGLRIEQWQLDLRAGGDTVPITRNERDLLWSANMTIALTDAMNLRTAAYRTLSRPDPREISPGEYMAVAGECTTTGTPNLNRALVLNADVRWEWYPAPGEVVSISGFYKDFTDPIIEIIAARQLSCAASPRNAAGALNLGGELEVRKGLGFIADAFRDVTASMNLTYVDGHVDFDVGGDVGMAEFDLQDQSRYLANAGLVYTTADAGFTASLLYNYFSDRLRRYGLYSVGIGKVPDVVELGRSTIDAKVSKRIGQLTASLSARNLTDARVEEVQKQADGPVTVGHARPGVSFSLGLGYVFQ